MDNNGTLIDRSLNQYSQPNSSPVTQQRPIRGFGNFVDYNHNIPDYGITPINVRNFNFSQGQGGTLILGGTSNGNGQFILKNSAGSTIVTGDNNGIAVTSGSINIKNSSGTTTLDSLGIVSNSQNFVSTQTTTASLNQVFTGTAFVDVTSSAVSFVLTRTVKVLILMETNSYLVEPAGGNTCDGQFTVNVDGNLATSCYVNLFSGNDFLKTQLAYTIQSLNAGTHNLKMQGKLITIYGGTPAMTLFDYTWSYLILGT